MKTQRPLLSTLSRRGPARTGRFVSRRGLTLVEVVIASGILAVLLLASAAAMGESVESTSQSRNLTQGALFLESVQEDLGALPAGDLLSMNGQRVFSADDWVDARYRVEISVFNATLELLQLRLALIDQATGREVAAVHGMRALI